jgi:RHS repeat-associated protein
VEYVYDAANRLIRRVVGGATVEAYVHDPINRILTFDGAGAITERRFTLPAVDEVLATTVGGATGWLLTDQVGSVRRIIGDTGLTLASYEYDSFGNVAASSGAVATDIRFQSREFDGLTGLGYFRARFYDPGLGRFMSEDPREPFGYDFAANNPLSLVDPFGEATIVEYQITIGGRTFSIALHSAHHSWRFLGKTLFCIHIQLLTYIAGGPSGNQWRRQIPLPWCRGTRF